MNVMEKNKCAHPDCNCEVSGDQKYCSTSCEETASNARQAKTAMGSQGKTDCGCNHSQCRMAA